MGRKSKREEEQEELITNLKECIGELMVEVIDLKRQLAKRQEK
ncbi:MAG TPA: hypothetical protein VMW25_03525 [Clostridia bacterium]|nr:hypothetical protein [Clostridia bacterium]